MTKETKLALKGAAQMLGVMVVAVSLTLNLLLFSFYLPELKAADREQRLLYDRYFRATGFLESLVIKEAVEVMNRPGWTCREERVPLQMPDAIPLEADMACIQPVDGQADTYYMSLNFSNREHGINVSVGTPVARH